MGKYDPLRKYLMLTENETVSLEYNEIEKILGDTLPDSAHKDYRWWLNDDKSHVQSAAWGNAGFAIKKLCWVNM